MQCKDIPDRAILEFLSRLPPKESGTVYAGFANSVGQSMPAGTPRKLTRAKMEMLIRRELVDGCACGCRGDFTLTGKGQKMLETTNE